ncbi:hypothetical protein PMIN03_011896, partial [Paraphaeosphaeria minitans]
MHILHLPLYPSDTLYLKYEASKQNIYYTTINGTRCFPTIHPYTQTGQNMQATTRFHNDRPCNPCTCVLGHAASAFVSPLGVFVWPPRSTAEFVRGVDV